VVIKIKNRDSGGRFIKGHSLPLEARRKISNFRKGRHPTEETRRKMSESQKGDKNHNYGKSLSEETKQKISATMTGRKLGPPWNTGKKLTEEHRRQISEGSKGKTLSEITRQKLREIHIKRLPTYSDFRNTSIELALQNELNDRNILYKIHLPVCKVCVPDIVFPGKKIAVFADGDHWHSKEFKNGAAWERDRRQDKTLRENGWRVLRFWGHEIRENVEKCVDSIAETLECGEP